MSVPVSAPGGDPAGGAIRYGQVWEDTDVLLSALAVRPGDRCLSIAAAGDNALALLTRDPAHVLAVDMNPAQLACLDLRQAAYARLEHGDYLGFFGARPAGEARRRQLYAACRPHLREPASAVFWDARQQPLARFGLGGTGRMERYFRLFRRAVLPLVHGRRRVARLLRGGPPEARRRFFDETWNSRPWRGLFRAFFSRAVMARLGRDPAFFRHVEGSLADHLLARTEHALVALDPADNPWLHWILTGRFGERLPPALEAPAFERIRARLDRLEWRAETLEASAARLLAAGQRIDRFNLSDVFEYMGEDAAGALLARLADLATPGARLVYWNMMVPRCRPDRLAPRLVPCPQAAAEGFAADRTFFYRRLVVEEATGA